MLNSPAEKQVLFCYEISDQVEISKSLNAVVAAAVAAVVAKSQRPCLEYKEYNIDVEQAACTLERVHISLKTKSNL